MPIFIHWTDCDVGHYNLLIIDTKLKFIERFEPYGSILYEKHNKEQQTISAVFDKELKLALSNSIFKDYKYINPKQSCPRVGFQEEEEMDLKFGVKTPANSLDPGGFCGVWSLWYANLRIKYPNIPPRRLQSKAFNILKKNPHSLRRFIRNYAAFLHNIKKRTTK